MTRTQLVDFIAATRKIMREGAMSPKFEEALNEALEELSQLPLPTVAEFFEEHGDAMVPVLKRLADR